MEVELLIIDQLFDYKTYIHFNINVI